MKSSIVTLGLFGLLTQMTQARGEVSVEVDGVRSDRGQVVVADRAARAGRIDGWFGLGTRAVAFAAAFATHSSFNTFLVGMAASIGAGISMGFAEALSDDGKLSGRGTPYLRGLVSGLMTIAGGIGQTLPYLIPAFWTATSTARILWWWWSCW